MLMFITDKERNYIVWLFKVECLLLSMGNKVTLILVPLCFKSLLYAVDEFTLTNSSFCILFACPSASSFLKSCNVKDINSTSSKVYQVKDINSTSSKGYQVKDIKSMSGKEVQCFN